jgi:hypothetical protein
LLKSRCKAIIFHHKKLKIQKNKKYFIILADLQLFVEA